MVQSGERGTRRRTRALGHYAHSDASPRPGHVLVGILGGVDRCSAGFVVRALYPRSSGTRLRLGDVGEDYLANLQYCKQIRRPGYVRTPVTFSCSAKRKVTKEKAAPVSRASHSLCCLLDLGGCGTRTMRPRAPTCSNSPRRNPEAKRAARRDTGAPTTRCFDALAQCAALIAPYANPDART